MKTTDAYTVGSIVIMLYHPGQPTPDTASSPRGETVAVTSCEQACNGKMSPQLFQDGSFRLVFIILQREKEKGRERETNGQTDRQTDRDRLRQTDRKKERQRQRTAKDDRQTEKVRVIEKEGGNEKHGEEWRYKDNDITYTKKQINRNEWKNIDIDVRRKIEKVISLFLFTFLQLPLAASMILGLNYVRSDSRVVI